MSEFEDPIEVQAFNELLISCQEPNCGEDFVLCFEQPATDPVEKWAKEMAKKARSTGWGINKNGDVACPKHSL